MVQNSFQNKQKQLNSSNYNHQEVQKFVYPVWRFTIQRPRQWTRGSHRRNESRSGPNWELLLLSWQCRPQPQLNNGHGSDAGHNKPRKTTAHTSSVALKTRSLAETLFNYRTLSATCSTEVQKLRESPWWVRSPCRKSAAVFCTVNKPVALTLHTDKQTRRESAVTTRERLLGKFVLPLKDNKMCFFPTWILFSVHKIIEQFNKSLFLYWKDPRCALKSVSCTTFLHFWGSN